jgi:predicted amidohydrolase
MVDQHIRVIGVQFRPEKLQREENLARMVEYIDAVADKSPHLIVFPECALSGYALNRMEAWMMAEPIPGPSTEAIHEACKRKSVYAVFGLIESAGSKTYNSAVLIGPEGVVGKYRKTHLPFQGVDRYVDPGDTPYEPAVLNIGRIGILICYDIFFPETVRVLTLKGAELIVVPANWAKGVEFYVDHIVFTRALENHVNLIAVNRVGKEGVFKFYGESRIVDPYGKMLAEASFDESVLYAELNMSEPKNKRIVRIPGEWEVDILRDRRTDLYGCLLSKT